MAEGREELLALWRAYMRRGDFEGAWRISDTTRECAALAPLPRHLKPVWKGLPFRGKRVIIRCYRGLGDTIQFIRYAPIVRQVAAKLIVSAQPEILPLIRTMPAVDCAVELDLDSALDWDVELEVTELPYVFRTTLDSVPAVVPYFSVAPGLRRTKREIAVGLVWAAGDWDPRRSVPARLLGCLAEIPGVKIFSFQRGIDLSELPKLPLIRLDWRDVIEEAGMLLAIDLLVSVDTMPAHLAGALGVPVWLLLHADPDWRWMAERTDSPWYPSMRLFRQGRPGDWQPVLQRIADELSAMSHKRLNARTAAATNGSS